jgi:hypothetical protein
MSRKQTYHPPRNCERPACQKLFAPKRPHAKFCGDKCRGLAWQEQGGGKS